MNILGIAVLYKKNFDDASTLVSLRDVLIDAGCDFKLLIYDNGPETQNINFDFPFKYEYIHDPSNSGLAVAYNYALKHAIINGYKWILLLDHDSVLPKEFLHEAFQILNENIDKSDDVVAIVPRVVQKRLKVSPALHMWGARINPKKKIMTGKHIGRITAINSGNLIRTSFLSKIGGFNNEFKIDYLDHWLFSEIERVGSTVYVSDTIIDHELSINNPKTIDTARYGSILEAEACFYKKYGKRGEYQFYKLHLIYRAMKQLVRRDKNLYKATLRKIMDFKVFG
jgi:GT2 family glycosyltransferase